MANNEALKQEYQEIIQKMRTFTENDNLGSRNELVPRINELNGLIDWGYKHGEVVERRTGRGWELDRIISIQENEFRFSSVVLPHQMIRKKSETLEQLSLF